jgi:Ca-activated chloride channel homolog
MNVISIRLLLAVLCLSTAPALSTASEAMGSKGQPVVILFDRSYSMNDPLHGQPKIQIAKAAFRELAQRLHGQTRVAVRFFAGGVDKQDDAANCRASERSFAMGHKVDTATLERLVAGLRPLGRKTNIAHAMEQAVQDLAGQQGGRIILISDGQENCDLDPIALSGDLAQKNIRVDTIGIGQPGQFSQLGRIALAGSGEFRLAASAGALAQALGQGLPPALPGAPEVQLPAAATVAEREQPPIPESPLVTELEPPPAPKQQPQAPPAVPAPAVEPLVLEQEQVSDKPKEPVAIELILDVSGSMAGKVQGRSKMVLARAALREAVRGLDSAAFHVGFRAYGFDSSVPKTPEASCPNTVLLNPISVGQIGSIRGQIDGLQPYGYTPIARSLELAGADLRRTGATKQMIILISDGEETCGGDPAKVAAQLRQMGIDVETHVVGFDLDRKQARQMRSIAAAGGGKYYDAKDAVELKQALTSVVEVAQNKIEPTWLRTIHPIDGGSTPETAVDLLPGTYTLTRFLEKKEQMFFRVNTKKAQRGVVRGLIQSKRLIREGGDMVESSSGYSQYRISLYKMRGKKNRGRFVRLSGEPGSYGHVGYSDTSGDGFIFTIGSAYDRVHKDALFNIEISEAGDKLQGSEAAGDMAGDVIPVTMDDQVTGHLGDGDTVDLYRLSLPVRAQAVGLELTPVDDRFRYRLTVKNSKGRRLHSMASRGGPVQMQLKPPADADAVFIEIKSNNPKLETRFTPYTLDIKAGKSD